MIDYDINRLLLHVGMFLSVYRPFFPTLPHPQERREFEQQLVEYLKLDEQIDRQLLRSYRFLWDRTHHRLRTIHLIPHDTVRRTPGIARLKQLFLDEE